MHSLATQNNMRWCQGRKKDLSNGLRVGFKGEWRQWPADDQGGPEQHKPNTSANPDKGPGVVALHKFYYG